MDDVILLYTTWPDAETAEAAGRRAVEAGLAACVNVLAPMRSIYRWEGAVESAAETPALFKSTARQAGPLRELILASHPYELPAVLALSVREEDSSSPFLSWVRRESAGAQNGHTSSEKR